GRERDVARVVQRRVADRGQGVDHVGAGVLQAVTDAAEHVAHLRPEPRLLRGLVAGRPDGPLCGVAGGPELTARVCQNPARRLPSRLAGVMEGVDSRLVLRLCLLNLTDILGTDGRRDLLSL